MTNFRRLPPRESVFIWPLLYHGFRYTQQRHNLKLRKGYIIPATQREDADGIDAWVKMPNDRCLIPIQVTQRGVRMFKKHKQPSSVQLADFILASNKRIREKQRICQKNGIAFVLVRDYSYRQRHTTVAWGDIKALRYAIAQLKRRL